jgi:peptide/nickel transport system substrate-binding protein
MKKLFILVLLMMLVVTVIGCSQATSTTTSTTASSTTTSVTTSTTTSTTSTSTKSATTTSTTSTSTQTQQTGGTLRISSRNIQMNLGDPARNWNSLDPASALPCVESLMVPASDGTGKPYPQLATSWQYSSDYKSITFNLRKNVKFHDGTDFNAQAAKFCLDLIKNGPRPELKTVTSIDVVDEYTIKLNLSAYQSGFLMGMSGFPSMMVSPTNYQKVGADKAAFTPVGTGPFIFDSFTPSVSLKYKRFDGYWGQKAYLDGIEIYVIADSMTSLAALKAGQIDATRSINMVDFADLAKLPNYTFNALRTLCYGWVSDSAHPESPFSDLRVRQAMAYAINTKAIADAVGYGLAEGGKELVPQNNWAYDKTTVGYPYDPKQAKINLALAGYSTGLNTFLSYDQGSTDRVTAYTMVQAQLKDVGINLELKGTTTINRNTMLVSGWNKSLVDFQFTCAPDADPAQQLWGMFSSQATSITPKSVGIPADYDAKLLAVLGERDDTKYRTTVQGLFKDLTDSYCLVLPIFFQNSMMISYNYVHDFNWAVYANAQWEPTKVWMSKH